MKNFSKWLKSRFSIFWIIGRSLKYFLVSRPVFSVILAIGVGALALWLIPMWQGIISGIQGPAVIELENQVRQGLAKILAGPFVLVVLYLWWCQVATAREGKFTERFTLAVGQLESEKMEVRIGGIYALERLAKNSVGEGYWTIVEVLASFVREQSLRIEASEQSDGDLKRSSHKKYFSLLGRNWQNDIQVAITILGRRKWCFEYGEDSRLDLCLANLRKIDFSMGHWEGVNFVGAHLEGAIFTKARLEGAIFTKARLEGAIFTGACLDRAILTGAHLEGAYLIDAHLEEATLSEANLEGAGLHRAHLEGANLRGAHLEGAILNEAHLEHAILIEAHLERASFVGACLERVGLQRAHLSSANLSSVDLRNVTGLTEEQIGSVVFDSKTFFPVHLSSSENAKQDKPTQIVDDKDFVKHNRDKRVFSKKKTSKNLGDK